MVGPNIHPSQTPQPPPPPPTGGQTSILGQPPTPPINPHIFNPSSLPPPQQNFPKPPSQPMFGQFEGGQPTQGVIQPPMPPFGIIYPPAQQNFVGQPGQNYAGSKEFLPGPMEGGQFMGNPMSQLNQGGPSEMSRFGVPLMKLGKSEPESANPVLGVTSVGANVPLPPMMMASSTERATFDTAPSHTHIARPGMFGMGALPPQQCLRLDPAPPNSSGSGSILGSFSNTNLDLFPAFLPMRERTAANSGTTVTSSAHISMFPGAQPTSSAHIAPPSMFPGAPPTSSTHMVAPSSVFPGAPPTSSTHFAPSSRFPGAPPTNSTHFAPSSRFPGAPPTSSTHIAPSSRFTGVPPTSSAHQELGGGENLLPIGTERAHKGVGLGGGASGSGSTIVTSDSGSSFPMLAPGQYSSMYNVQCD